MVTGTDVRPLDPPGGAPRRSGPGPLAIRRAVGVVLIAGVVLGFLSVVGFTRLDAAREEVAIATAVDVARAGVPADQIFNCFQGFCFEDDQGFLEKWWGFSSTYLLLIWPGIVLALVVGGLVDGFLYPSGEGPAFGSWRTAGTRVRARLGGSSLVPVGRATPDATALSVGALNAPALAMTVVLFSPSVWLTRLGVALAVGVPLALWLSRGRRPEPPTEADRVGPGAWDSVRAALRDSAAASGWFAVRLIPLFVIAAALGGLGTRWFTEAGVASVAGNHPLGILLAAVVGLLLDVPLTFGLPLGALALLIGADPVVVGVFLVTATLAGPRSLTALARGDRGRAAAVIVVTVSLVGSLAGFGVARAAIAASSGPTIAWDGETCSYRGPVRFGPRVHDFTIRNDTEDFDDGKTLAIVIGRLPANVSVDHLAATVAADRKAPLPEWFTVAGTQEFIFPGTEQIAPITLHDPGTYAAVCLYGGGYYVIFEFSMRQPMGWFDEFRPSFDGHVADQTFVVEG